MLKKFECRGFKGFSDWITFDFQAGNYSFNQGIVRNGMVNKAIVYGKNGSGKTDEAVFRYAFQFGNSEVVYEYAKKNPDYLLYEKLWADGRLLIDYRFFDRRRRFVDKDLQKNLNIELIDNRLSVLKYIYRNTAVDGNPPPQQAFRLRRRHALVPLAERREQLRRFRNAAVLPG